MGRAKRKKKRAQAAPPGRAAPPPSPPRADSLETLTRFAGPAAIAVTAIAMLVWTWRTWPDPLVDYGREAYLAWQAARGKTLYVDVAHFNGPFSVYLNAGFLRLFGPSILTLALANAALTAGCVALLYAMLVRVADRLAAALGTIAFVTIFAFGRFVRLGNYNWLCPYSYELTHGVMLAILGLWFLDRYHRTKKPGWLTAMGASVGLLALTKTETLLAGGIAAAVGLALTFAAERPSVRRLAGLVSAFLAGVIVPLAATFAYFASRMPLSDVLRWPFGYWRAASRPEFAALPMYREGIGIDDVAGNVRKLAEATGGYALVLAAGVAAAVLLRGAKRRAGLAVISVAGFVAAWTLVPRPAWLNAGRPLPLLLLLVSSGSIVAYLRARRDPDAALRYALQSALAVFALALLAKMILNARLYHYGFALAMPATVVLIAALLTWAPALATRAGVNGRAFRVFVAGVLVAGLVAHLGLMQRLIARQTQVIGEAGDAFSGDDRVAPLSQLLDEVKRRVAPTQTFAALPEGALLNYLARRDSSVPYVQYSPVCMLLWGEQNIERDLKAKPPDFLALVHRDNRHEGARFFGRDYARPLMSWIRASYHPVWRTGAPPLSDRRFGLVLLERNRLAESSR